MKKATSKILNEFAVINMYRKAVPVDIFKLCEELGVSVRRAYLDDEISGMIENKGNGQFVISVNATDHINRQRFTVAHELGHYMLHRSLIGDGVDDDRAYRSTNKGKYHNTDIGPREETEANRFAADVLMPWASIKEYREKYDGRAIDLAAALAMEFQVSQQAMEIRLS